MSQNLLDLLSGTPWLITPQYMQVLLTAAEQVQQSPLEAISARRGRYLPGTDTMTIRDGVAVMEITGPIMRFDHWWFRASNIESMAADLRTALDDPLVRAILLNIDSPGGATTGVNEFANMVYEARGEKPIVAYSNGQVASAAYWIGSAADELVIDPTTQAGSIGVVYTYLDDSEAEQRRGYRRYQIASTVSPAKLENIRDEAGRAAIQRMVDDISAIFVETVARNRDVSTQTVIQDFGQGGVLVGRQAVEAGLADRIGSLESVLSEIIAEVNPSRTRSYLMNKAKGPITVTTTAELRKALTDGHTAEEITIQTVDVDTIRTAAKAEGIAEEQARSASNTAAARKESVEAERTRIASIHAITLTGFEQLAAKAIADGKSPGDFALEQTKAAKDRGGSVEQLRADAPKAVQHGGEKNPAGGGGEPNAKRSWGDATQKFNKRNEARRPGAKI